MVIALSAGGDASGVYLEVCTSIYKCDLSKMSIKDRGIQILKNFCQLSSIKDKRII